MADSSFDVVSNVDRQEVDNALNQAKKELAQRFDFKNTGTSIEWSGDGVTIASKTDKRAEAALDVFKDKLVRRKVSLKALESGEPKPAGGGTYRIECSFIQGIPEDKAKSLAKTIRQSGLKVQAQVQNPATSRGTVVLVPPLALGKRLVGERINRSQRPPRLLGRRLFSDYADRP